MKQEKIDVTHCASEAEAQALANFLWNEQKRHLDDIDAITEDLVRLQLLWHVQPRKIRVFVKP